MGSDSFEITRPCPIDLNAIAGQAIAEGRRQVHCGHCDKQVHLLDNMTETELEALDAQRRRVEMCVAKLAPEPSFVPAERLLAPLRASAVALSLAACTPHEDLLRVDPVGLPASDLFEPREPALPAPPPPPSEEDKPVMGGGIGPPPLPKPKPKPRPKPEPKPWRSFSVGRIPIVPSPPKPPPVLGGAVVPRLEAAAAKRPMIKRPFEVLMATAIYTPDPDPKLLAQTKAARFDRRGGKNVTRFCVDVDGRVVDVKTQSVFPGDPEVDRIIRNTIRRWRFKPQRVDGKPVRSCSQRSFELVFGDES